MKVVIVDYKMGNVRSVLRSFEKFTNDITISADPQDLKTATHIVLPGVGSFADGMKNLEESGVIPTLIEEVTKNKIPFLGICLGMQLLASVGYEGGKKNGLNLISGHVRKLIPTEKEPVPHVGWNEIHKKFDHPILHEINDGTDFYFVHGYHFLPDDKNNIISITPYLGEVVSIVADGNIIGMQFHPEKSQISGFKIIKNFLEL